MQPMNVLLPNKNKYNLDEEQNEIKNQHQFRENQT